MYSTRHIALAQRLDDLLRLAHRHIGVVGAMEHQRRRDARGPACEWAKGRLAGRASVAGSPYSTFDMLAIQGSVRSKKVSKLTTP